jgi:Skp family chaperone for outer membrane proteins
MCLSATVAGELLEGIPEHAARKAARKKITTMKTQNFKVLAPGILATFALALAMNASAQTPPPAPSPATKAPQAAPMTGHHMDSPGAAKHHADMKAECQGMMAKKQEMQDKLQAMDASLDKLVADMNAAKGSKEVDALEKPMAAVINELVAQRKASRSMMMEMQPAMMSHMMHHMHGEKGAMECPMMKMGSPEPKAEEKKPQM